MGAVFCGGIAGVVGDVGLVAVTPARVLKPTTRSRPDVIADFMLIVWYDMLHSYRFGHFGNVMVSSELSTVMVAKQSTVGKICWRYYGINLGTEKELFLHIICQAY